jgi:hypothetical protein
MALTRHALYAAHEARDLQAECRERAKKVLNIGAKGTGGGGELAFQTRHCCGTAAVSAKRQIPPTHFWGCTPFLSTQSQKNRKNSPRNHRPPPTCAQG